MGRKIVGLVVGLLICALIIPWIWYIQLTPLTPTGVYNGVWNLQPTMNTLMVDGYEQPVTTNAFQILNFDPDGPITSTVYATSAITPGTFITEGTLPAVHATVGDVVWDENTPPGETSTGLVAAWYRFHMVVETNGKFVYATPSANLPAEKYHSLLFPQAELDDASVSVYFDLNLRPTPLFNESFDAYFEKVHIEQVKMGISTYPTWDQVQIQSFVDDWAPGSIAPSVDFYTTAGGNIIDQVEDITGGQIAHCHLSMDMRCGFEWSQGAGNPYGVQITVPSTWTPHNVYAELTLVAQLLIDPSDDGGGPPPQVGWWESFLNVIRDFQTRVQTWWEALAKIWGPILNLIIIGVFGLIAVFIIVWVWSRRR